jgi:hypothetical protein
MNFIFFPKRIFIRLRDFVISILVFFKNFIFVYKKNFSVGLRELVTSFLGWMNFNFFKIIKFY